MAAVGTAEAEAVVALGGVRHHFMVLAVVAPRLARVENRVRVVLVGAAVKLVGSAPDGEVKNTAAHLAVLRGEVTGLEGEFLHCLHGRLQFVDALVAVGVGRILTIHAHGDVIAETVDDHVILAPLKCAGRQIHEGERAAKIAASDNAEVDWEGINREPADGLALLRALRPEHFSTAGDGDGLGGGTDLEDHIDTNGHRHIDPQAGLNGSTEPRGRHRHVIETGRQGIQRVVPGGGGYGVVSSSGFGVLGADGGCGHDGSSRIGDSTSNCAALALSERSQGKAHE